MKYTIAILKMQKKKTFFEIIINSKNVENENIIVRLFESFF